MKQFLMRCLALILVAVVGLTGCSSNSTLTGNYGQDTLALISTLRTAIAVSPTDPDKVQVQTATRQQINEFAARYRRDAGLTKLNSYTTMRTALNALAGHYSSYPNRPVPDKLKARLEQEFQQIELALKRGS